MASFNAVEMVNQIPHSVNFVILCSHLKKTELPIQLRYLFEIKVINDLKIQYLLKANATPVI